MGIWDRLFGGRFTMPPPEETNASHAAIMREMRSDESPEQRHALKSLTQTLLAHAPEHESARLVRRVLRKFAMEQHAATALSEGLLDDTRGQKLDYLALLAVDWRGYDGFEYLAPYLASASGVQEPYVYVHDGTSTMPEVLGRFDQWLARFGKRYVHLDSGDDDFQGFIIDAEQVEAIIELARVAGINASLDSF
ncbi:DUF6630 family protein [Pseudomonas sp. K2I15]|uniref:DUF6630 family protein n=1 Tax=unclassified Pseudomonas TaxID=196821 RepID=UPI000B4CDBBB|nr:hypothetical protein [Pseudomonas sp. K2I15]OWP71239.1 hypothetical protein CEC48_13760 [Pseudomonas sp. K2I15]